MSLPDLLASAVGEGDVVATVDLGGEDVLAVTADRTLIYRADGLLSDESIEEYPHGAERIDVSEGRRKTTFTLDYGLDGEETVTVPAKRTDDALHPLLAGVLSAADVTDPGESVLRTFRFSELTLIITSDRVVKHVGSVVWDDEFEEFHYGDVVDLGFEEGTVATSIVLTLDGRQERFKAPNESARSVKETLSEAVCAYHDVESVAELRALREEEAAEEAAAEEAATASSSTDFGEGPDPLSPSPSTEASSEASTAMEAPLEEASGGTDDDADPLAAGASEVTNGSGAAGDGERSGGDAAFGDTGFEPAGLEDDALAAEIEALRETVEAQGERIDRQAELIDQLIEELRRGR
ncbi:hypothetical protein ACFQAS_13080 [Halopenitus salinus]|uniref:DUF7115 domain-containing protein n=1 Tax=Halopenitus salinus TaxID=1198295 RepID=A0ABD5V0X5_9EURY